MKIRKNIVMRIISVLAIMCTAISMAVFPSYAVDASRINSKGNIVLEDGAGDVALYAEDAGYLYNEISNLYQELPEISNSAFYGTARKSGLNSKGIIDYANGTVVIDSSDFAYLADEIDSLEAEYKANTVAALNAMGTFFLEDGSINHVDENLEEAAVLSFETIYEGIKQSQSVDHLAEQNIAGAIEDNLSKGTAAWLNGELIIGNGADNDAYYKQGVSDGHAEVVANPSEYGVSASTLIDTIPLYTSSSDFSDNTYYLSAPHDGTCTFVVKVALSCHGVYGSTAHDFKCTIYRDSKQVSHYSVNENYNNTLHDADFYKTFSFTVPVYNCTAGETLKVEVYSKGLNATWIMGIK